MQTIKAFLRDENGAAAIEYGLIASIISLVLISVIKGTGTRLNNKFTVISNALS